jgi:hypothetical protein
MSIKKPLGLSLLVGLMAMAFVALPAIANAAPELTNDPAHTTVAKGTTVTATSTNATTVLGVAPNQTTLTCTKVAVHGIVEKNTGTEVEVKMESSKVDTAEGCKANGVLPVAIEPTLNLIKLTKTVKTASFEFTAPALGLTESSDATASWIGECATSVHIAGAVSGSASGTFTGDFTLEDANGKALCVD